MEQLLNEEYFGPFGFPYPGTQLSPNWTSFWVRFWQNKTSKRRATSKLTLGNFMLGNWLRIHTIVKKGHEDTWNAYYVLNVAKTVPKSIVST